MSDRTMKEIALDLLAEYEAARTTAIWEFSSCIEESERELDKEIKAYKAEIEEAAAREDHETGGDTMKKLETIQKAGKLNEVYRVGEPGPGGAYHTYAIAKIEKEPGENPIIATVKFQKGPRSAKTSRHGVLDHELIEIVRDRLKHFQMGEFAAEENEQAIYHLEQALDWMNKRVEDRIARGVLGKEEK